MAIQKGCEPLSSGESGDEIVITGQLINWKEKSFEERGIVKDPLTTMKNDGDI
jgi:hypothetical protein